MTRNLDKIDFKNIKLLLLDVDGILTDGSVTITESGEEIKTFFVRDGSGIRFFRRGGGMVALLTGRGSPAVLRRAEDLDVNTVRLNASVKLPVYLDILKELNVTCDQTAVMGDDLMDLPLMDHCGFAATVADAVDEVKNKAHYITNAPGGRGAVREVVEIIMKRAGTWAGIMQRYEAQSAGQTT